jgi:hypothetical protein
VPHPINRLSAEDRKTAVTSALSALHKFKFYPEQVDALLYFTHAEVGLRSAREPNIHSFCGHALVGGHEWSTVPWWQAWAHVVTACLPPPPDVLLPAPHLHIFALYCSNYRDS